MQPGAPPPSAGGAFTSPILGTVGNCTTAPPYSFQGDGNNGWGSASADNQCWVTDGTTRLTLTTSALISTVPFLMPDAGIMGSTATTTGFAWDGANARVQFQASATPTVSFADGITLRSVALFGFSSGVPTATADVMLARDAANILAQRNGTNAQMLRVYKTDNGADDEWFEMGSDGSNMILQNNAAGAGSLVRPIVIRQKGNSNIDFYTNNTLAWRMDGSGHLTAQGAFNIGDGGTSSPVNIWAEGFIGAEASYRLGTSDILMVSATAPTISSGFGTSPSIAANNGTAAFTINVGTGGTANSGVIGLPAATTGWSVHCADVTTQSATVFLTKQTATTTTTATIGNFDAAGAAAAWVASNILVCQASAY